MRPRSVGRLQQRRPKSAPDSMAERAKGKWTDREGNRPSLTAVSMGLLSPLRPGIGPASDHLSPRNATHPRCQRCVCKPIPATPGITARASACLPARASPCPSSWRACTSWRRVPAAGELSSKSTARPRRSVGSGQRGARRRLACTQAWSGKGGRLWVRAAVRCTSGPRGLLNLFQGLFRSSMAPSTTAPHTQHLPTPRPASPCSPRQPWQTRRL